MEATPQLLESLESREEFVTIRRACVEGVAVGRAFLPGLASQPFTDDVLGHGG